MSPKKAFRFKKRPIAIRAQINGGVLLSESPTIIDRVIDAKVSPSGFLAYHPSIEGIGYSITHIPTGLEIAVLFSEVEARKLIEEIDGDDWDFKTLTQKLKKQLRRKYSALVQDNS